MAAAVVTTTVLPPRATAVATTLQRGLRLYQSESRLSQTVPDCSYYSLRAQTVVTTV